MENRIILLFDRKTVKENMMSRVFLLCVLIIQIVAVLFLKGVHGEKFTLAFWEFFGKHKILIVYWVVINFGSIIFLMGLSPKWFRLSPSCRHP